MKKFNLASCKGVQSMRMKDRRVLEEIFYGTVGRKFKPELFRAQWFVFDTQPSWKLWGEQKANDIVYTIYLKKVRYHRPSKSVNSDSEDEISHLEWETVKVKLVKAATLRQLVNSLACADTGELESTYVNIFLATYRTFASTEQVMELLLERYREVDEDIHSSLDRDDDNDDDRDSGNGGPDPAEVREAHLKALRQALAVWLDVYPSDFPPESNAVLKLLEFLNARCPNDTHLHNRVAALVSGVPHTPSNNSIASARMSRRVRLNRDSESSPIDCDDFGGSDRRGHDEIDCHVVRCASPLPNGALTSAAYPSFFHIPEDVFAQQLTRMDKELFVKLQPHQCLGAIWGKSKERLEVAGSVKVTVDQFNAVSFRVLSTVLMDVDQKPSQRAKVIAKWIEIAQELRLLKNFSSLKAIISGLQSTPIYRLRKVWSAVPKEKVESYEELARLFSEDNNQLAQRELLQREGTAKVAEVTSHADRFLPRLLQRHNPAACSVNYGTIPYLGTFLTDLTMINTAIPNTLYDNLINFDKKRKEFEILAQIKLLQGAAASYNIKHDARFQKWFDSCPVLEDKESFELSCLIEVQGPLTPSRGSSGTGNSVNSNSGSNLGGSGKKKGYILSHQKTDSMTSTSSGTSSQHKDETCDSLPSSIPESIGSLERKMSTSSTSSSSGPSVDPASSSTGTAPTPGGGSVSGSSVADSGAGGSASGMSSKDGSSSNASPYRTPDFYIIRVSIESGSSEQQGVNLYKSIMLGNSERTKSVIANAMLKHGVEGRAEDYTLSQILPHGEMMFPNNANVYYAINTSYDLNFILRKKRPGDDDKKGLTVRDHKTRKKLLSLMT